jgi:hypothetical protein
MTSASGKRYANKQSVFKLFLDKGQFKDILEGLDG